MLGPEAYTACCTIIQGVDLRLSQLLGATKSVRVACTTTSVALRTRLNPDCMMRATTMRKAIQTRVHLHARTTVTKVRGNATDSRNSASPLARSYSSNKGGLVTRSLVTSCRISLRIFESSLSARFSQ